MVNWLTHNRLCLLRGFGLLNFLLDSLLVVFYFRLLLGLVFGLLSLLFFVLDNLGLLLLHEWFLLFTGLLFGLRFLDVSFWLLLDWYRQEFLFLFLFECNRCGLLFLCLFCFLHILLFYLLFNLHLRLWDSFRLLFGFVLWNLWIYFLKI